MAPLTAPIVDDIFWNLWVEDPKNRGIDEHFYHEGEIKISFIINGENINSLKFTAEINWTKEKWDKPTIKIEHNGKYIHDCVKGDSENAKKPR